MKRIEIFKTGKHTDSNGNTREWTEDDLSKIVNSYNPQVHEAPVVIGHPKDNAPAFGWVETLKKEGGVLYAQVKDLVPEFVDTVRKGLYKKRSISLYPDMSLRHIGFLGALPPAIKGLADISFSDKEGIVIESVVSGQWSEDCSQKEEKGMKFFEWLKGLAAKDGVTLEDVPQTFSEADVQVMLDAELKKKEAEFSEKVASIEEARKKKDAELKAREDAIKAKESEAQKKEVANFCEGLLKEGRLTPAMMKHGMGLQNFLEQVSGIETMIEFGEGDKKESQTPIAFMQSFLSNLHKSIEFGGVAGDEKDVGEGSDRAEKLISDFMEKSKGASYKDALLAVSKEHLELFKGGE